MSTILVANTPHSAALLYPAIAELHPEDGPVVSLVDDQMGADFRVFDKTPISPEQLPKLQPPRYIQSFSEPRFSPRRKTAPISLEEFIEEVRSARNVYLYGQGARRVSHLYHASRLVRLYNLHARILVIEEHVHGVLGSRDAVVSARTVENLQAALDGVAISDRFHFNYQLNSDALLAKAFARHGLRPYHSLSPFTLQFLFWLREREQSEGWTTMSEAEMQEEVAHWKGTGAFPMADAAGWHVMLGASSYMEDPGYQLVIAGLMTTADHEDGDDENARRVLTPQGRALADEFDDSCHDPDLPFRIEAWKRLDKDVAFTAIDDYLFAFFSGWYGVRKASAGKTVATNGEAWS